MSAFRYVFNMEEHRPALRVGVYSRGGIVNGDQTNVNTVLLHNTHDIAVNDKFLYALTRSNIRTERIFTCTARDATGVTFSGLPFTFPDKCLLVPLGLDTGGVLQSDGTYSQLAWDGSTVAVGKDPNMDALYTAATLPIEPGGEVGFWCDSTDIWVTARSTGGQPLRIYIFSFVDAAPTDSASTPSPTTSILDAAIAWYRADAISGVADGGVVTTWEDMTGNGNTLTADGCTGTGAANAVRPKYNAAGTTKGTTALPAVSFESDISGGGGAGTIGFFTLPTPLSLLKTWTIALIMRDYTSTATASILFGLNGPVDDVANQEYIKTSGTNDGGATGARWIIEQNGGDKFFSSFYKHTHGDDTEVVLLRSSSAGTVLESWIDGSKITKTADTNAIDYKIRYVGRTIIVAGTVLGAYRSVAEIIIFDSALSDTNVGVVNNYLLGRASTAGGALYTGGIPANIGTSPSAIFPVAGVAALGTDSACTNGTAYVGSVFVPANMQLTGIQYLVGSVGGTDSVIASLHSVAGVPITNSGSTTVGTANQIQQVPFGRLTAVTGPAWYFVALTFNGTTAKFRTIPLYGNAGSGVLGNGVTQTFGTVATFTAPTTFTADKVPIASVY